MVVVENTEGEDGSNASSVGSLWPELTVLRLNIRHVKMIKMICQDMYILYSGTMDVQVTLPSSTGGARDFVENGMQIR